MVLAGIDVGLARIAGTVDQKVGSTRPQRREQGIATGVFDRTTRQVRKFESALLQQALKGLADISGGSEDEDQGQVAVVGDRLWACRPAYAGWRWLAPVLVGNRRD